MHISVPAAFARSGVVYNVSMKLPERYLEHIQELLGEEYPAYLEAMEQPPAAALRINTSRITADEFRGITPFPLKQVPWCTEGFYYGEQERPGTHPYYAAGVYYLQEASAMIPGTLLPVKPGDRILDACAAPGGKSTQTASRMNGTGVLLCNDLSASRQAASLRNLERAGVDHAYVTCENALDLAKKLPGYFDGILLDAPCSGEGMFRKDPSLIRSWKDGINEEYAILQKELINACADMLRDGGYMVYSTCTFSPKEDEEVVLDLLAKHPECTIVKTAAYPGFCPGVLPGTENCLRLYPHHIEGEGHFAALIRKGTGERAEREVRTMNHQLPEFFNAVRKDLSHREIRKRNGQWYALPEDPMPVSLRSLRTGLFLGTEKRNGFEPSQALAMTLSPDTFEQCMDLDPEDERVLRYLRGETIFADKEYHGWILVCTNGFPLGFAKASGTMLKNKIDPGWRRQ